LRLLNQVATTGTTTAVVIQVKARVISARKLFLRETRTVMFQFLRTTPPILTILAVTKLLRTTAVTTKVLLRETPKPLRVRIRAGKMFPPMEGRTILHLPVMIRAQAKKFHLVTTKVLLRETPKPLRVRIRAGITTGHLQAIQGAIITGIPMETMIIKGPNPVAMDMIHIPPRMDIMTSSTSTWGWI
jgi:hypothetical protein